MKRYILTVVCIWMSLTLIAQSGQYGGAPANVEAVDLGLPSGTRWANMNVGASSPEEYGGYYAWGETEEKDVYNWSTYIHCDGTKETCHDIGNEIAGTQYDVAHVKWGIIWQMPTIDQVKELIDNCSVTRVTMNGVDGCQFTGPNGNSIFLPTAGSCWDSGCYNNGVIGLFWPSTLNQSPQSPGNTYCFEVGVGGGSYNGGYGRYFGHSVRPVLRATSSIPRTFIDLGLPSGTKWANMNVGASRPEEYGKYFAWGETLEKGSYTWDNYMCPELTCGKSGDPIFDLVGDKADIAGTKFDAAAINWGTSWNMPTAKQVEELASNCYSSLVTINGVPCRKLVSRINGNEIIFPLSGARWFEDFAYEGSLGYYWASTLRQGGYVSPGRLIVEDDRHGWGWSMGGENDRFCAFPIRPVYVENNIAGDTVTLHKFSASFNDSGSADLLGTGITFQRDGTAENYSLSANGQQGYDSDFDISKISYITRRSIGQFSLPEESGLTVNDITITVDGDTISTDDKGNYDASGSTLVATNKDGEVVYMNIATVEDANNAMGADLNAKESAITLMLPLVPNIFVAFDDEYLPKLKEMIWDVDEVKQLAEAIDRSVVKYGYTDFGEISKEATTARNKISQLLHLDELAKRLAAPVSLTSRGPVFKASGTKIPPYIENPYGYGGLQVEITNRERKQFYSPYNIYGYNCEVTAYNSNRFAYSSMVKGKYDTETNTYYIPDLRNDYDYHKNILKPQKVSTFLNTFTSFKSEDLEKFGNFIVESVELVQGDIGFSDMHWDDMKKSAYFDINAQDDAIVLLYPRGNDYMLVYNILQSIVKPIVKTISKKAGKAFDSDILVPFVCGKMLNSPDYIMEITRTLNSSELKSYEKVEKIRSLSWTNFFKAITDETLSKVDKSMQDVLTDFIGKLSLIEGGIEAAFDWTNVKAAFKALGWVKKYGDIFTGLLGTFFENNAVYPIYWEADGQFVVEKDEVTLGEGENVNVRILVGNNSYFAESSDEKIATASGAYNRIEIHGVHAGDAVITVKDKVANKDAKIKVHVTGVPFFVLAESEVSVPMYKNCSVTIESGDGPFHIFGGDEKISVAKLGGGNPLFFPGEKYAVVVSGISEGSTTFKIYDEATNQFLPLKVNVTAEEETFTDERIVDLGLSVKWANCNVGANSPEEYGDYFAWGEVTSKDYYSPNNYTHYSNGNYVDIGSDISGTDYDAATHNMGDNWRMPTKAEYDELINKCEWKLVTYRKVRGWRVTGPNGNSIFLPLAGYMLDDWNDYASIGGFYWSSNVTDTPREVHTLYTTMSDYKMSYRYMNRYEGRTIRAVTVTDGTDVSPGEAIDLGLPSGTLWASCNVGATKPEEVGGYYAWGETEEKRVYDWDTYIHCDGTKETCHNIDLGFIIGTKYDVAHSKWGGNWRMPGKGEFQELVDECIYEQTIVNGINGIKFTGPNGNSIFLPNTGYRKKDAIINEQKLTYWSGDGYMGWWNIFDWDDPYRQWGYYVHFLSNLDSSENAPYCIDNNIMMGCYGLPVRPVQNAKDSYAVLSNDKTSLTLYCDGNSALKNGTIFPIISRDYYPRWWRNGHSTVISISFDSSFANANPTTTRHWFYEFEKLEYIYGLEYLNTSQVTNMNRMFAECENLSAVNVSNFNTSKVTDMSDLFIRCRKVNLLDVSHFNTSKVTNFNAMFNGCESVSAIDVSHFDTSKAQNMYGMFNGCRSLESIDVSSFNTSNVTTMDWMFGECSSLKSLDVSNFDMTNVTEAAHFADGNENLRILRIPSSMDSIPVLYDAFDSVGTKQEPCILYVPKGFNFNIDTSGSYFKWNGGYFRLGN